MNFVVETKAALDDQLEDMLALTERLVNIDSGSYDPDGVNRVQDIFEQEFEKLGFEVTRTPLGGFGDQLTARWNSSSNGKRVLILGHADTVWPAGTVAEWAFTRGQTFIEGPGVGDMKGCVVMALYALGHMIRSETLGLGSITFLVVPNEEIGSPGSREWIEAEARKSDFCVTLEPARPGRGLVIGRGAVGALTVEVEGVTAHIAHNRTSGASAIAPLAKLVGLLEAITDEDKKTSVSVGLIKGGEARQVVPPSARLLADLRAADKDGAAIVLEGIEQAIEKVKSEVDERVRIHHEAVFRPAFPISEGSQGLYSIAAEIAGELGLSIRSVFSPGGSDASTAASIGVPTIDGLGPITHEMCSRRERVEIASIAEQGALFAELVRRAAVA